MVEPKVDDAEFKGDAPEQPRTPPEEDKKELEHEQEEDIVTGIEVKAASERGIDYDKLIVKFGCYKLEPHHLAKIEEQTQQKVDKLIRRGLFFCHRDLDVILKSYEEKKPFYLYTGRGPSAGSLHLGRCIPFMFNKYLQDAFDVPLVIQITDDEKFLANEPELEKI